MLLLSKTYIYALTYVKSKLLIPHINTHAHNDLRSILKTTSGISNTFYYCANGLVLLVVALHWWALVSFDKEKQRRHYQ